MEAQTHKFPAGSETNKKPRNAFTKEIVKNYDLYLLLVPGVIFFFVFCYIPMFGLIVAFKDYNIFKGVFASDWVGLAHFRDMLTIPDFYRIVRNTLLLNVLGLIVGFPAPIILALLLNEVRSKYFKKISQSLLYLPHFMSWIIMGGIIYNILSPKYGIANDILRFFGMEEIYFMIDKVWWVITYTLSSVWAGAGWGTIIYLAAMTTIDPSLYEAANIDGAGRWKKIIHITIPGIMPTVIILLILNVGHMVSIGFEHPFALQNPVVMDISEVISTYIYSAGIKQGLFGLTTAIGMSQAVINLFLVLGANYLAKRFGNEGLW
ncbi:MAG: sugar transporter ATPase [Paenibacillus sp.]|jgi:putative aldouronate transport system permease protein|nr:sugar transporter ATPase [Paenibacillus sp.]